MIRPEHRFQAAMPRTLLCLGFAGLITGALQAQPTITGAVVDDGGAAAADVEVVLRPHPSAYEVDLDLLGHSDALPEAVDRVRSDADGAFSLSAPNAGPYVLELWRSAPESDPEAATPLAYGRLVPLKGSRVTNTIEAPDRHVVVVRALDKDDRPIEGALVVASPTLWLSPRTLGDLNRMAREVSSGNFSRPPVQQVLIGYGASSSRTDAEGIARLPMPTADATVFVSASGFVLGKGRTRSGRGALRLERDPGVRLRVRGPTGAPAPGVVIRTASARDRVTSGGTASVLGMLGTPGAFGGSDMPLAVTDDSGEAVLGRTPGSETALELEAADHAFARVTLPAQDPADPEESQTVIDVRLEDPLRIPGRTIDAASGLPIPDAAVWVQASPGQGTYSSPAGAFDLNARPAPGGTRLLATATGFVPERIDISAADLSNREEVQVALRPSAPIRGVVTNEAGQPIVGASIRAEPRGADVAFTFSFESGPAASGPDGAFQVEEALYGYPTRLTAEAAGHATSVLDLPPLEADMPVDPVHLVLSKGRRVLGSVVDTAGNPVAEAQVSLLWPTDPSDFRSMLDTPAGATVSDDQGAFALPPTGPGEYQVRVSHSDYADRQPSRVVVPAGESDFDLGDLTLAAGGTIHGIVTGPDGEPVGRATIQARERRRAGSATRTATTDADGEFRLDGFSSDLADLGVRASGYPLHVQPNVGVNQADPVRIELQPGAAVTGRVLDGGGNGVAGVPVRLRIERDYSSGGDPRLWNAAEMFPRRVTGRDGRFRFDRLAAGTWSAETRKDSEGAKLDGIELMPGAERGIELVLQTRDRLTVIVATQIGEPVADADIRLEAQGERRSAGYGRTDGSGRAVIDIAPGTVTVEVSHDRLRDESRQVRLEAGDNEARFELLPGLELGGTVRSYDGAPLALATVEAETEYSLGVRSHRANTVSDHSGAFRVTGLEARRYIVTARAPGYADGGPEGPIELGDHPVEGIEIVLEPEASIAGAVTGLSPSDLTRVRVYARKGPRSRDATTDTDGTFSVQGIGPGTWDIRAVKGDWERTVQRSVTVERGMAEVFVELPFERGLRLTGEVVEGRTPLGGARLSVGGVSVRADGEGRFALEGLEPGPNQVFIRRSDLSGGQYQSIDLQTDMEGVVIELSPAAATVSGVVVDAGTGQPLDYASLMASDATTIGAIAAGADSDRPLVGVSTGISIDAGTFKLELSENADHLWVTLDGYESAQIPLGIAPGEHREGLVIRLQPTAAESPDQ
jgi:hypothetical protein